MSIARSALIGAPGKLFMNAVTFWSIGDITLTLDQITREETCAMFGTVDETVRDGLVKAGITPYSLWQGMTTLLPAAYRSPTIGARIFGDADVPAVFWLTNGSKYSIVAAAVTKPPVLKLGVDQDLFGPVEITGVIGTGLDMTGESSLITIATAQVDPGGAFAMTNRVNGPWTGAWGAVTGFTAIVPQDHWEVSCELKLNPVVIQGQTRDYKIGAVRWMAKCKPTGPTAAQMLSSLGIQGANNPVGRRLSVQSGTASTAAPDLTLTGPGSKSIVLNQAHPKTAGFAFGDTVLENGELGFVTTTEFATGTPAALITISD